MKLHVTLGVVGSILHIGFQDFAQVGMLKANFEKNATNASLMPSVMGQRQAPNRLGRASSSQIINIIKYTPCQLEYPSMTANHGFPIRRTPTAHHSAFQA